jgi:hypothetical protein
MRVHSFAQEKEKIRGGHTQWWIQEWRGVAENL